MEVVTCGTLGCFGRRSIPGRGNYKCRSLEEGISDKFEEQKKVLCGQYLVSEGEWDFQKESKMKKLGKQETQI